MPDTKPEMPERIKVSRNEPNGELVASFPGELYPADHVEFVCADLLAAAIRERDEARAEIERLNDLLLKAERIYYTEGKDAAWIAAAMRDVVERAALGEPERPAE